MEYQLSDQVFAIPYQNKFILYAPLKRLALLVNRDAVQLFALIREGVNFPSSEKTHHALRVFQQLGLLDDQPERRPTKNEPREICPTSVTLFPTYDCNLRCVYCYASGGEEPSSMLLQIAQAAIDLIAANAIKLGKRNFQVNFHGGGEPTLNWQLLVQAVEYAQGVAREFNLDTASAIATNGILSKRQVSWIAENIRHVNISLDGPPGIHNRQRGLPDGRGSFEIVFATLKRLEALGVPYGIRTTITQTSVSQMGELVSFFCDHLQPESIHLEPLFVCGRCLTTKISPPDPKVFLSEFLRARELARRNHIRLHYSGCRLNTLTTTFCGAAGRNFVVLPDGHVTACYEVCRLDDPRAGDFVYGRYDPSSQTFVFDQCRLDALSKRSAENVRQCADCFLKWHCAGDCLAKAALISGDMFNPAGGRCWLNQEIAKHDLIRLVVEQQEDVSSNLSIEPVQI